MAAQWDGCDREMCTKLKCLYTKNKTSSLIRFYKAYIKLVEGYYDKYIGRVLIQHEFIFIVLTNCCFIPYMVILIIKTKNTNYNRRSFSSNSPEEFAC